MNPGVICTGCNGAKQERSYRDAVLAAELHQDLSDCESAFPVENLNQAIESYKSEKGDSQ